MGKHSYEFSNEAQNRLEAFDADKKVQENNLYWESLIGDAGKTDFSEDAQQRLLDAQTYHEHRLAMEARDDTYSPMDAETTSAAFDREWDAAIEENEARDAAFSEKKNSLDAKLASNVKLRQIQRLSNSIEELREQKVNADNADHLEQLLVAKEDRLESLLLAYENESNESPADRYEILDYTLTGRVVAPSSARTNAEASSVESQEDSTPETPQETTPLFDELANQYGLGNENLAADAKHRAMLDDDGEEENLAADLEHRAMLHDNEESLAADAEHRALLNDDQHEGNLAADPELRALLNDNDENLAADAKHRAMLDDDGEEENLAADLEHRAMLHDNEENLAADAEHRALLNDDQHDKVALDHPMTRGERVLAWWNGSRMHSFFEKRRTSKNMNRTVVALGAVVLGAAVASRLGWFHDFGFDPNITPDHHDGTPNPDTGNNGGDHEPQAPKAPENQQAPDAPAPAPTPNPEAILALYEPAFNVPYASGGLDLMGRLNVPASDWYDKVVPGLLEKYPNDFYPEQVNGYIDVRFDRPGPLPKEIQRDILHRLGKI
jgi:hypothetical protein